MGFDVAHALTRDWLAATLFEKACYFVVVAAGFASLARAFRLARLLYAPLTPRRRLEKFMASPNMPLEQVAHLMLAGRVVLDPPGPAAAAWDARPLIEAHRLHALQTRVDESSRSAEAHVAAVRGWLCLAVAIAMLAAALASDGAWEMYPTDPTDWSIFENANDAAIRLAVMLPPCLVMAVVWTTFDAALQRRRSAWAYAVAVVSRGR
jgi:hypothetical protein